MPRTGRPPRHGLSNTPTYYSWRRMRARCHDEKNKNYKHYGAKGVRVCSRWHSFDNFVEDMGLRPSKDHVLSRHGDIGNYEPGNCVWLLSKDNEAMRVPACGEKQHLAKITEQQIPEIRRMRAQGMSYTSIGKLYGVYRTTIKRIIVGKTWKHVP